MGYGGDPLCCRAECHAEVDYNRPCAREVVEMPPPPQPKQPTPTPPCPAVGEPVSVTTGDMFLTHTDAVVGDLAVIRSYNTARLSLPIRFGVFGPGWNASFDARLNVLSANTIEARLADGSPQYYFDDNGDGVFESVLPHSVESRVRRLPDGGYRRILRRGGRETYDSAGKLRSATDPAGVETTYARDAQGRVTSVTRLGRSFEVVYFGGSNRPETLLGPSSVVLASYTYYPNSQLETVTYAEGSGYRYQYDGAGRILYVRDLAGKIIEAHGAYDVLGRATTSEIGDGVEKLTLAYQGNETTVTDARGNVTIYEWANVRGTRRVTKITGPCASCGGTGGETSEWTYDARGNITAYKDGAGNISSYTYDPNTDDLLTEARKPDPVGNPNVVYTTTYTYFSDGRVDTRTAPDGGRTSYTYVAAGPESITETVTAATPTAPATTRTTRITYTPQGKPRTVTDPRGKVTTLEYYPLVYDLESITDPLDHVTRFTYDFLGRREGVKDALDHITTTKYDERGRVTKVIDPHGKETNFIHEFGQWPGRRLTKVTDALTRTTQYSYDLYGRLEKVTDARQGATRYGYDAMSNLTSLTDANDHVTTFKYDVSSRLNKVIYPLPPGTDLPPPARTELFTYDLAGRLLTKTDRRGIVTTHAYDGLGRLKSKSFNDGTTPPISYTYDPMGRLATATNNSGVVTREYNLVGELLTEASTRDGSTVVAYTYDLVPNVRTVSLNGALIATHLYDDDSLLQTITRGSSVFDFDYWETHNRQTLRYPNGVTTSYTYYDDASRLKTIVAAAGAGSVLNFLYEYDDAGNGTRKTTPGLAEEYGYDETYRLQEVKRNGTPSETYTYDDVGNRETALGLPDWSYNELNQLLSQNGTTYEYDANGNLVKKVEGGTTWTYSWDALNQLTQAFKSGIRVSRFVYDALGRRVLKGDGSVQTRYVYDGEDILREERSGGNVWLYIHGPGIDEALAREDQASGAERFFHADALGSRVKTTNASGTVTASLDYDAFGQILSGAATGYSYTGREYDVETGLYYYRARYYDPRIGRFLSEDPIGFDGGINFYAYVSNNPINLIDPLGLCPCKVTVRCRPVHDRRAQSWSFGTAKHCYLVGSNESGPTTFSGGPIAGRLGAWATPGFPVGSEDSVDDPILSVQEVPCSFIECLKNATQGFNDVGYAYNPIRGPNSNSYAGGIMTMCGLNLPPFPFGAFGSGFFGNGPRR
jgi:RHS repeat-associated protein